MTFNDAIRTRATLLRSCGAQSWKLSVPQSSDETESAADVVRQSNVMRTPFSAFAGESIRRRRVCRRIAAETDGGYSSEMNEMEQVDGWSTGPASTRA
jgi:hypothetical protein